MTPRQRILLPTGWLKMSAFPSTLLVNNIPALVQIMAGCWPGYKPLSEPMMVRSSTHIWVTRLQWVKDNSFKILVLWYWHSLKAVLFQVWWSDVHIPASQYLFLYQKNCFWQFASGCLQRHYPWNCGCADKLFKVLLRISSLFGIILSHPGLETPAIPEMIWLKLPASD